MIANVRPDSTGTKGDVYAFRVWNVRGQKRVTPYRGPDVALGALPWGQIPNLASLDRALRNISPGFVEDWNMRSRLQYPIGSIKNARVWKVVRSPGVVWRPIRNWGQPLDDPNPNPNEGGGRAGVASPSEES